MRAHGGQQLTSVSRQKRPSGRRSGAARDVILGTLARNAEAVGASPSPASRAAPQMYYTLTREELAALAKGNVKQIERWVGTLDKGRARWLWNWLSERPWQGDERAA